MNYYPHHIGDFDRATRHLTRIERSIYRDLIELYYDTEQPLTLDREALCRKIIARSTDELTAVEQTLNEFFTETQHGWYHERCEDEISRYRANNSQKSKAGKASALKKEAKRQQAINARSTHVATDVEHTSNGASTNQEPITNNQEPIIKNIRAPRFDACRHLVEQGVDENVARDWLTLRKTKKAAATETAIAGVYREASKANLTLHEALEVCCSYGWAGFKAEWIAKDASRTNGGGKPFQTQADLNRAGIAQSIFGRTNEIDITPEAIDADPFATRRLA